MDIEYEIRQILLATKKEFPISKGNNIFVVDIKESARKIKEKFMKEHDNLTGSFAKDLSRLEILSREVGYQSCKSNDGKEEVEKYLNLRNEQILLLNAIIQHYGPKIF